MSRVPSPESDGSCRGSIGSARGSRGSRGSSNSSGTCAGMPDLPPHFEPIRELGRGSNGIVVLAEDTRRADDRYVAIKVLGCPAGMSERKLQALVREVHIHGTARHPHIVHVREVFQWGEVLGIVMDYVRGGTLLDYVNNTGPMPEKKGLLLFQQLVAAVRYVHQKMASCHRDVKLDNVLVERRDAALPRVYLCDFSFAKTHGDRQGETVTMAGSVDYFAPEILLRTSHSRYDGMAADMWSLGVCLHALMYQRYPKLSLRSRQADAAYRVNLGGLDVDLRPQRAPKRGVAQPDLSEGCLRVMRGLLTADPANRLTMEGLMQDPWFRVDLAEDLL